MYTRPKTGALLLLLSVLALGSCAESGEELEKTKQAGEIAAGEAATADESTDPQSMPAIESRIADAVGTDRKSDLEAIVFPGTDSFVQPRSGPRAKAILRQGKLILNFENAALREVVRIILGDTLKVNYVYDPRVQGTVSLETTRALPADAALSVLETVLRMNGAALVIDGDLYRVVPADEVLQGNVIPEIAYTGQPIPRGYSVRIVPLEYISAIQMEKLLEPFLPPNGVVRVDVDRNLLILAGTRNELSNLIETVQIFDVDWLAGMSVAIYPLTNVDADVVAEELDVIFGDAASGPLAGLVRFVPLKRLNALLAVSPRAIYIEKVEEWIQRLDRGNTVGQNLYVYPIQHGKASEIAKILTEVFASRGRKREDKQLGRLAPGRKAVELRSAKQPDKSPPAGRGQPQKNQAPGARQAKAAAVAKKGEGLSFTEGADIRIIADEVNNALLILASAQDYRMVKAAVRKIDIMPLQVLIEATIAEVTLTEELRFGLQWFFNSEDFGLDRLGTGTLSTGSSSTLAGTFPGFSFVANNTRIVLDALEGITKVNVLSAPQLMVLDNHTAELKVGDEVPVTTQQQQSTSSESNVVNTIQFRDTGVILRVTPRVSAGGSINMEIEQEVSGVSTGTTSGSLTPTISTRRIKSSIVIQSGETVVLGGLISDTESKTTSGIPFLQHIPILGWLFGSKNDTGTRTELIVLISPRLIRNSSEARDITREVRARLKGLRPIEALGETAPAKRK